jgi:hypothetical protein
VRLSEKVEAVQGVGGLLWERGSMGVSVIDGIDDCLAFRFR